MKLLMSSVFVLVLVSCSSDDSSSTTPPTDDGTSAYVPSTSDTAASPVTDDDTAAAEGVMAVAEGIGAAADSAATSSALADTDFTFTRTCTKADSGEVTVDISKTGTITNSSYGSKKSLTMNATATGKTTRIWTPPTGGTVACNDAKTHVKIDWKTSANVSGLKVTETVDEQRSNSLTITTKKKTVTRSASHSGKGTRTATWEVITSDSETYYESKKTVTSSMERTAKITNKSGEVKDMVRTVKTVDESPLVISIKRDKTSLEPVTKTIESGSVQSTNKEGIKTVTSFSELRFNFNALSTEVCIPVAGTITGKVFAKDATTASKTFVIDFAAATDSGISISIDGAEAVDYPEYAGDRSCDLRQEI